MALFRRGRAALLVILAACGSATLAQQPATIGERGVEQALAALEGGSTEAKIQTGFTIITRDNLEGEGADAVYQSGC